MKLIFIGATHEVTGSCTFVQVAGKNYLVDYGMRQGKETFEYVNLPVPPAKLDGVFLTHAHIDHSGMLPKLYKNGFRGAVYCTEATKNLCQIMLEDSAYIQETEAEWENRKKMRLGAPLIQPEYTVEHAQLIMKQFVGYKYDQTVEINGNVSAKFHDVGHLLGSSAIELILTENGVTKSVIFSGDVGNVNHPIICDPKPIDGGADYVVLESTYGDREHERTVQKDPYLELASYIQRALDRGGNLVIPAFAVGRTQEILYLIKGIKERGLVSGHPSFPVYLDSPLANAATNVFNKCDRSFFDEHMLSLLDRGINPLLSDDLKFSETAEDSKLINMLEQPKVIISSSGMCDAGRIRHHLKHNLWNAKNVILFVGYQAEGSLGRLIIDGKKSVKLFGEEIAVKAEICNMHGTSGHADRNGLIGWLKGMQIKPKTVFVNHGTDASVQAFCNALSSLGYASQAPYSGAEFDLVTQKFTQAQPTFAEKLTEINSKQKALHVELMQSVNKLKEVAQGMQGCANSDVIKLTKQIKQLIDKFK